MLYLKHKYGKRKRVVLKVAPHGLDRRSAPILSQQLLLTVIEQLKLPLMNIARHAELAALKGDTADFDVIRITADSSLRLLDNYLLGIHIAGQDAEVFNVEPISVASVLYDTGSQLQPLAKAYGVGLELQLDGKFAPVMAHRQGLQAALVSLGYALVEAVPAMETRQLKLQLSAHRCRYGVVAGIYCDTEAVTAQTLRLGRQLYGRTRQPLGNVSHTSSAGVFVADAILQAMQTQLSTSRHHRMHGLGAVLPLSPQLQLV